MQRERQEFKLEVHIVCCLRSMSGSGSSWPLLLVRIVIQRAATATEELMAYFARRLKYSKDFYFQEFDLMKFLFLLLAIEFIESRHASRCMVEAIKTNFFLHQ